MSLELTEQILTIVERARREGRPIRVGRGPFFDNRLKKAIGINLHKSIICTRVKLLVKEGALRYIDTGDVLVSGGSCLTKEHPVLELVPA